MKSNNIWYLDRGKNFFTEDGVDFFETIIAVINSMGLKKKITSNELIEKFPNKYKNVGNPNALLTTVRNIAIIDKNNCLLENVKYYLEYKLSYKELILENLSRINYDKEGKNLLKPFFIICMFLYQLYNIDEKYAFITKIDCKEFLYEITEYKEHDIYDKAQKIILRERDTSNLRDDPVLDIWFNALQEFDIFEKTDSKNVLKINKEEIAFFEYIYNQCRNRDVKEFADGLISLIPEVKFKNKEKYEIKDIYNFLFGIDDYKDNEFCEKEYYAIYKPFRKMPNIAIRKIEEKDEEIASQLFRYNYSLLIEPPKENEETTEKKYICPKCGGELGIKKGRYGFFISCSNFPRCNYTKSIKK